VSDEKPEKLSKYWGRKEPGPIERKGIRNWVEEQIEAAMAEGTFDNLPGKGKPLNLGPDHPWEEKDWLCNHILSNAHVVPEWIMLKNEIEAQIEWLRENPRHRERDERIQALNRMIDKYNLVVPAGFLQKPHYPLQGPPDHT
jgi:hypothetical protein